MVDDTETADDGGTARPGLLVIDGQAGDVVRWHASGTGDEQRTAITLGVRMAPGVVRPVGRYTGLDTGALATLVGAPNAMRIGRAARSGLARGTLEGAALSSRTLDAERTPRDHASEVRRGTDADEPNGIETEQERAAANAAEQRRREAVREAVRGQFRVEGNRYRFKDGARGLAFTERATSVATASNDPRAARAVAALADAKGWGAIRVKGHANFRREVWIEARARGIAVRGYTPTEQDVAAAEKRERLPNRVERVDEQGREALPSRAAAPDSPASSAPAAGRAPRDGRRDRARGPVAGTLVEHGPAPYRHDPTNDPSYRVKLSTEDGEREVWGVDLKRAMSESKARPGDVVELRRGGQEPVAVDATVRNEQGVVVGRERISTNRNAWGVRVTEWQSRDEAVREQAFDAIAQAKTRTPAAASALGAELRSMHDARVAGGAPPLAVAVHDPKARSAALRRGVPIEHATRDAERTRTTERGAEASL